MLHMLLQTKEEWGWKEASIFFHLQRKDVPSST
jgi:hypothetical protein